MWTDFDGAIVVYLLDTENLFFFINLDTCFTSDKVLNVVGFCYFTFYLMYTVYP